MTHAGTENSAFWITTYVIALCIAGLAAYLMTRYLPFKYHWIGATMSLPSESDWGINED